MRRSFSLGLAFAVGVLLTAGGIWAYTLFTAVAVLPTTVNVVAPASITVSPTSLNFGDVLPGASATRSFTATNPGASAITSISILAQGATPTSIHGFVCKVGATPVACGSLAAGASYTVDATINIAPAALTGLYNYTIEMQVP